MQLDDRASEEIESIGRGVLIRLDAQNQLRDRALNEGRQIIRLSANSVRSTHRHDYAIAQSLLGQAGDLLSALLDDLALHPGIRWAGYVQDPMKEFAEASITLSLVTGQSIPGPEELGVDDPPYLNGLAESASELRRQILDAIRHDDFARGESLLASMEQIYGFLVTVDFPDGLTGGLRRTTDALRAVLERTRGDLTVTGAWGEPFALRVIVNHWKSKGGDETVNAVRREAQARHVATLVQERLDADPAAHVIVLGDLNDYYQSNAVEALRTSVQPPLVHSYDFLPPLDRYTYVFNGASQVLDHLLITANLLPLLAQVGIAVPGERPVASRFTSTEAEAGAAKAASAASVTERKTPPRGLGLMVGNEGFGIRQNEARPFTAP